MFWNTRKDPNVDELRLVIERGIHASTIADNPIFRDLIDDLTSMHIDRMMACPVGKQGREERERNHALQVALTEIVQELVERKNVGLQAQERLNEEFGLNE